MKTTSQNMRSMARKHNKKQHRKSVIHLYRDILKTIRRNARAGRYGIESRYIQVATNFETYIALRLLSRKNDFKIRIYCEDEEYATNGIFNYGLWSIDWDWQTRIKYIINW